MCINFIECKPQKLNRCHIFYCWLANNVQIMYKQCTVSHNYQPNEQPERVRIFKTWNIIYPTCFVSLWVILRENIHQLDMCKTLIWIMFVRASLYKSREEKPTRCYWVVYCTYNLLDMFRALIWPSSVARDYTCVIAAYGVWCLGCWWSSVRSRAAGYAPGMREIVRIESNNFPHSGRIACCPAPDRRPPATKASHTICGNNTSIVSSYWWWTYKCPKHVEQIISTINDTVASSWFFYSTRVKHEVKMRCY